MAARKNKNKNHKTDIILQPARKNKIGKENKPKNPVVPSKNLTIGNVIRTDTPRRRIIVKGEITQFATWNVQDLTTPGKMDEVISEMERLKFNVLGMSDTRWKGSGKHETKNGIMYYSGINKRNPKQCCGVALLVDTKTNESVTNFTPYSDRVLLLKFTCEDNIINLIQVCAPREDEDDKSVGKFYMELEKVLRITNKYEVTIIMGCFNAIVGEGTVMPCVGKFGLGTRNKRGDTLVKFCQKHELSVCNTWYELKKQYLYTYAPDKTQVDYVLINRWRRFHQKFAKTYPRVNMASNYQPLLVKVVADFKKADTIVMSLKLFKEENAYKRSAELDNSGNSKKNSEDEEEDDDVTKDVSDENVKESWDDSD